MIKLPVIIIISIKIILLIVIELIINHFGKKPSNGGNPPNLNIISIALKKMEGLTIVNRLVRLGLRLLFLINKLIRLIVISI